MDLTWEESISVDHFFVRWSDRVVLFGCFFWLGPLRLRNRPRSRWFSAAAPLFCFALRRLLLLFRCRACADAPAVATSARSTAWPANKSGGSSRAASDDDMEESSSESEEEELDMETFDTQRLVKGEEDQKYLDSLGEFEREGILAERFEEIKAAADLKRALRENK